MLKSIFITVLMSYLLVVLLLFLLQRKMLYFPTAEPTGSFFQQLEVKSQERTIKVLVDNPEHDRAVLYFGGNAESAHYAAMTMKPAFDGFAVYYINYPGYGGSEGSPSEETIIQAGIDLFEYVAQKHQSIALVGRSLGTGVAMSLANKHQVSKVVLISPYDSIAAVAATHYPFIPVSLLIKDKFDSLSRTNDVRADVLIVVGDDDKVIPVSHSQNLYSQLEKSTQVEWRSFNRRDHNNLHLQPEFMPGINGFLNR